MGFSGGLGFEPGWASNAARISSASAGFGFRISSGGRVTVMSVNRGIPLVMGQPDHPVSQQIFYLADAFVKTRQLQPA